MNTNLKLLPALLAAIALAACGQGLARIEDQDQEAFESSLDELTTSDDELNGLYVASAADGGVLPGEVTIESWSTVGIRLTMNGQKTQLTRAGDVLSGIGVNLNVKANKSGVLDDSLDGTVNGQAVVLKRDTAVKPPIVLSFPGDRPFRSYLTEVIVPAAHRDRESYVQLRSYPMGFWLRDCELYRTGSWQRRFFKGATWSEQSTSFHNVIKGVDYVKTNPRRMTKQYKFSTALNTNLSNPTADIGLASSTFAMYFPTAAGRGLRWQFADDSLAYFITDRPSRGARIGLVVMDTPTHGPLASTFGRQLLDLGEMPVADSATYVRVMMDLLVKSDVSRFSQLSGTGRSALVDWYSVMAIEDYRGVAFSSASLGWGYNMTNVQFFGLVTRALARPSEVDADGKPVKGQVVVGTQLRPGEASYADVLNNGNDMQEYADMARLKQLTSQFLKERHPALVAELEASFAGVVPYSELDSRARNDVFHYICAQLYDSRYRTAVLKDQAKAARVINAVAAIFDTLQSQSTQLEAYLLSKGLTKSNVAAPKSTGF
ncbi:MAG: hypothetical protein GQE15_10580 [Archangiaceae bacterium]|nr:hypothetical protein [Archangiaceae bacterium]